MSTIALIMLAAVSFDKATYYAAIDGLAGSQLRDALCAIIQQHTEREYNDLWEDFQTTDCRADGKVWDMYSGVTNYTFGDDQAGNYSAENQVYNREHSFPKSWFNNGTPMYTDLYHLYPTDAYVNGKRSNYCFGNVNTASYTSDGGFSTLGTPTSELKNNGCTESLVFEPNDMYKGDFARTYFYMLTAYADQTSTWSCGMLSGGDFTEWARLLLIDWAWADSVSAKETDRIEAVYAIQGNRNPYIDFPGLEEYVWGSWADSTFSVSQYRNPQHYDRVTVEREQAEGSDVDEEEIIAADGSYILVTDTPEQWDGVYLIAYRTDESVTVLDGSLTTIDASGNVFTVTEESHGVIAATSQTNAAAYQVATVDGGVSIQSLSTGLYIGCYTSKNVLASAAEYTDSYLNVIALTGGVTTIQGASGRILQYNSGSGNSDNRFRYYTGTQKDICLYRFYQSEDEGEDEEEIEETDGIAAVRTSVATIRDLSGRAVAKPVKGIYIVNGKKVIAQ